MKKLYEQIVHNLLSDLALTVGDKVITEHAQVYTENGAHCTYLTGREGLYVSLDVRFSEDGVIFWLDAASENGFPAQNALSMKLGPMTPDGVLASRHDGPWWMYPDFSCDLGALKPKTQSLLLQKGVLHYHLLPLCEGNFRAEFEAGYLHLSSGTEGLTYLTGAFLAVSVSTDPYEAVNNTYTAAVHSGAISVPLREERCVPSLFDGFGWCTWDAFYNDVSSALIYEKLEEFRAKEIPVKWIIIDAGWMQRDGRLLQGLHVNDHFPEGLAACVKKIKEEYGIEKVGIWHTLQAFWDGIDPASTLAQELSDALVMTASGKLIPALDEDGAARFWDAWYSYLAECGIDFVKVDNQSSLPMQLTGTCPTPEGCRAAHAHLERAVDKYFDGIIINCMGMDMENVLSRPRSAVSRNSDDFYPTHERGFIKHLYQNAYNAVWHSHLYCCDYDMWWSDHPESAVQSGVLRAVSGSPVYVSDKIGETNRENILPLLDDDGSLMRCEGAAVPTRDCLYTDCAKEGKLLRICNYAGENFTVAAFNVSEGEITDTVDFGSIPGISEECEYIAYEYFSKTYTRVNAFEDTEITLGRDGVAVWSLYPIQIDEDENTPETEAEYVLLGSSDKYAPIAQKNRVRRSVSSLGL
ncbi:MAG: hypothetical protein IJW77_17875 [Clostridia bacterium]|nr:hypothetical protein [Clostridia bacterium]